MEEKEWTDEERSKAEKSMNLRCGNMRDYDALIMYELEINEARKLLDDSRYSDYWDKLQGWLSRNNQTLGKRSGGE